MKLTGEREKEREREFKRKKKENTEQVMNGDSTEYQHLKELWERGHAVTWPVIPGRATRTCKALKKGCLAPLRDSRGQDRMMG